MRPIDADALIEKCGGWYVDECTESGFIGTLENLLATEPTIQPVATDTNVGDTISRQQAIDGKIIIQRTNGVEIYYDEAVPVGYLKRLPSVQPEPDWIPVSERLPDDLSEVNVTWINHNPEQYYEFTKDKPFTATAVYYKNEWYWYSATCVDYLGEYGRCDWNKVDKAIEIVAWMPLPEHYREGADT